MVSPTARARDLTCRSQFACGRERSRTEQAAEVYVYYVCMARVNIYLPDDLASAARGSGLNVSLIAQEAIRSALSARSTDGWLSALRDEAAPLVTHDTVLAALDSVREDAPTRHG